MLFKAVQKKLLQEKQQSFEILDDEDEKFSPLLDPKQVDKDNKQLILRNTQLDPAARPYYAAALIATSIHLHHAMECVPPYSK